MPYLYAAPWAWVTEGQESFWQMPRADIGLDSLDLRSLPQCGSPGPTPQGFGLFVLSQQAPIGYYLGDSLGSLVTTIRKQGLKTALDLGEDIVASTPLDILVELLNRHADPTGQTRWKPLRGSLRQGVRLSLAGREVWTQALDAVVLANTVAVFQVDYRRNRADGIPLEALRKWTGATMLKLWGQMSDALAQQLLPSEYAADGWQPPSTVITESFNQADSTILGPVLSWTEYGMNWRTISNEVIRDGGSPWTLSSARADTDLSSDDQYAQLVVTLLDGISGQSALLGGMARFNASADTGYATMMARGATSFLRHIKRVDSVNTNLASDVSITIALPQTPKVEPNNSTIKGYLDSVEKFNVVDTAITGNLRAGLCGYNGSDNPTPYRARGDSFEAGDLAAVYTETPSVRGQARARAPLATAFTVAPGVRSTPRGFLTPGGSYGLIPRARVSAIASPSLQQVLALSPRVNGSGLANLLLQQILSLTPHARAEGQVAIQVGRTTYIVPISLIRALEGSHSDILGEIYSKAAAELIKRKVEFKV